MIDDGSRDQSWDIIGQLRENDPRVKGVRFSRNFGHQAAVTAGMRYSAEKPSSRWTATCSIRRKCCLR